MGGALWRPRSYPILARRVVVAEAMALLHGCELAAELGYWRVTFESDSSAIISSLQNDVANGSWYVYPILVKIKRLGNSFQYYRWS
ncbi:ribonuclease H protein [Pyrus ussuriensis x Pyrus communis]|uniref:Ribonuclease H protein n=1 Tax=Pyrus ussuriensis x Pyrus communis TaxID=2448454 RepID=A0A5N5GMB6_9ROSA|nr:ribonuclease H protein [Pyrus ussuriensis x Pyrus communis]